MTPLYDASDRAAVTASSTSQRDQLTSSFPTHLPVSGRVAQVGGLLRRAVRREAQRLREPRRIAAIGLLALTGGIVLAFLVARGELAGSDARAYWAGVRLWVSGEDPFHPRGPFLPYVYAPWSIPLFLPWAALPWTVAWFVWRGMNVLLLMWSIAWAYERRPLGTALVVAALGMPIAVTLDTGNITLFLALAIWATQFVGPRLGGALWAMAASLKWFPALLLIFLPPRARLWGVAALAVAVLLALATWPQTLIQLETAINFPRPFRWDYLLLLWGAVPWFWRHPRPLWWLSRSQLPRVIADGRSHVTAWWHGLRTDRERAAAETRRGVEQRLRSFFGVH